MDSQNSTLQNLENDYVTIDVSQFPFVRVTMHEKTPTDEEVDEFIAYHNILYGQDKPFVFYMEFPSKMFYIKAAHRIKMGNWLKKNKNLTIKCKGNAFVAKNFFFNVLLKAIHMIQSPPNGHIIVNDEQKAIEWLKKKMDFELFPPNHQS